MGSFTGPTKFAGRHARGARSGLAPIAVSFNPAAPFCEENDQEPRPGRWPSPSLDCLPRSAFRRRLNRPPRCLESASTTDVSRHEHPPETALPETTRRAAVGNPAGISTSRSAPTLAFPPLSRQTPDHLAVIQPPAVTRLTAHYRLRVIRRSRFAFAGPLPDAALAW